MKIKRTFDILDHIKNNSPKEINLAVKRNGKWEKFSTQEYVDNVNFTTYGFMELGIKKGDKIASVSNNRPEWNFIDMAMNQLGAVHVPIYPTVSEETFKHIFTHSESRLLFLGTPELYQRIKPYADDVANIEKVYAFDKIEGAIHFDELVGLGKKHQEKYKNLLNEIKNTVNEDDLCSIIYTSGTTGLPKGVMLSHKNFMSNVLACGTLLPLDKENKSLSFLPLCHVLERMVNYLVQYLGASVYYAESIETMAENVREIKPNHFTAVPRVFEKVYDKILAKGRELTGIKRSLFFWAVNLAEAYEFTGKSAWYKLQLKIADKLIFKKWREALGNEIKVVLSGGAALQVRLARVFWAAGIKIIEGYGLTETSPVIAVNRWAFPDVRFGTVGPLIETSQVKIAEDGEILFKGPNLMLGYYKEPEKTKEVIDEEGWFHTGDIGELQDRNILKITDRKKEIFKLSTGKYVAPQVVENRFKESSFIEQIIVVGADEKFTAAMIVPNFDYLRNWGKLHELPELSNLELIENEKVLARFTEEVERINALCNKTFKVKKFALVPDSWSPETGELSPTLKLKRKVIKEKYRDKFDRIYGYK